MFQDKVKLVITLPGAYIRDDSICAIQFESDEYDNIEEAKLDLREVNRRLNQLGVQIEDAYGYGIYITNIYRWNI